MNIEISAPKQIADPSVPYRSGCSRFSARDFLFQFFQMAYYIKGASPRRGETGRELYPVEVKKQTAPWKGGWGSKAPSTE